MNTQLNSNQHNPSSEEFLRQQADLTRQLTQINYPDPSRTAHEILKFTNANPQKIAEILQRLSLDEPLAHIFGFQTFCEVDFKVTSDTLIPRPESEKIIELVVEEAKSLLSPDQKANLQILDIGTGSGALIISIAIQLSNLPQINTESVTFIATDISKKALEVAQLNAKNLMKNSEITFENRDLIDGLKLNPDSPTLICANLPYIPTNEYLRLEKSVLNFEPHKALDGGNDGLDLYRELWQQIQKLQLKSLFLIVEIDPGQVKEYIKITNLPEKYSEVIRDLFGVDRFIVSRIAD